MRAKSKRLAAHAALHKVGARFKTSISLPVNSIARAARELGASQARRKTAWNVEPLEPKVLLSADALPGVHTVDGSVDQPGEQDRYEFIVQERTRFLFDGVQGDQIQWQLRGSNSTDQFDFRALTNNGDRFLDLDPGKYTLTVDGVGDHTGTYAFRLMGMEAAVPLTSGATVAGTLQPGAQGALYSFNAEAGDRLFLQAGSGNTGGTWTLFDPTANVAVSQRSLTSDSGVYTAQRSGTYWLSVEGQSGATAALNYGFTTYRNAARVAPLNLGQTYSVSLAAPGDAQTYTFDLDRTTQVMWDQLSAPINNAQWVLVNTDTGSTISSAVLDTQDGVSKPLNLAAGHYQLRLEAVGRGQGATVAFRLLDSSQADVVAAGEAVAVSAGSAQGGAVHRIDVSQASTLSLAHLPLPDADASFNTLPKARDWLVGGSAAGNVQVNLGTGDAGQLDVQVLRVLAASGDQLHFSVTASDFAQCLRLFDTSGHELANTTGSTLDWTATSTGLLYLGVSRAANANYDPLIAPASAAAAPGLLSLALRRTLAKPESVGDVGDVMADASDVLVGASSSVVVNATIGDGVNGTLDVDFHRLVLAAGETFRLSTPNGTLDGYARLFDANGVQVASVDDSPMAYSVAATGVYYLGLSGYPNSTYLPTTPASGRTGAAGTMSVTFTREPSSVTPSSQWVVTDRQGNLIGSASLSQGLVSSVALPSAGSYFLWTNPAFTNGNRRGELRVGVWSDAAAPALNLDPAGSTTVNASLTQSGQSLAYNLTVATGGVWVIEPNRFPAGAQWRLSGPLGVVSDWSNLSSDLTSSATPYLTPGNYRLEVRTGGTAVGDVTLSLVGQGTALELSPGAPVPLPDMAVGSSLLLRSNATPTDTFAGSFSQAGGDFTVRAFDAYGRSLAVNVNGGFLQGSASGPVYVRLVRSSRSTDAALTYTLTRTPAASTTSVAATPVTVGSEVNDTNANVSSPNYTFTLAQDGWMALEWQEGTWTNWTLSGPRGVEANGALHESFYYSGSRSWNAPVRWLPAGTYTLQLSGGSGLARFSLRSPATANPITTDTPVAVDVGTSDAYELFDVTLDADLKTFLRALNGAGTGNFFRLYDAAGVLQTQGDPASTTPALLSVPRDGHYLLAIARNTQATGSTALRFDLSTMPAAALALPAGGVISGHFVQSYDYVDYALVLTEASQISLSGTASTGSSKTYTLRDAAGNTVENLSYYGEKAWGLAAGRYTLRVQRSDYYSNPSANDTYTATVQVTNNSRALGVAQPVSLQLNNGMADAVLQMNLEAGQSYVLTTATDPTYYQGMRVKIFDPSGDQCVSSGMGGPWWYSQTSLIFTAPQTGTYRVILGGSDSSAGLTGTYGFKLTQAAVLQSPLRIGVDAINSLTQVADEGRHAFTLTEAKRLLVSVTGDAYQAQLVRTDTGTTVLSTSNTLNGPLIQLLDLAPGSYEWRIQATKENPGSYRIRMDDVASLSPLALDTTATATVAQGRWATAWSYDGTAGELLTLDSSLQSDGYGYWQLIGPNGAAVSSEWQYGGELVRRIKLTESGHYVLILRGDSSNSAPQTSTVVLRRYTEATTPMSVGDQVSGSIAHVGDIQHYSFTLATDTTIALDPQGGAANLTLTGPNGDELSLNLDSVESYDVRRLRAGTYSLDITADALNSTPSFGFKLLNLASVAQAHGEVTKLSGDIPAGRNLAVHSFEVLAGHFYNLDFLVPTVYPDYFRYTLVDAQGRTVSADGWTHGTSVSFTPAASGPIYLVAKQYYSASAAVHFDAALRQPTLVSTPLPLGSSVAASLVTREDRADYSFSLDDAGWLDLSDVAVQGGGATCDVIAPDGTSLWSRNFSAGSSDQSWQIPLSAGRYVLRVHGASDGSTVAVGFTPRTVARPHQLDRRPGAVQAVSTAAGESTVDLWSVNAAAGDSLNLTSTRWPGAGSVQLFAPNGSLLSTWNPASGSPLNAVLDVSGIYLLRVTRPSEEAVADNAYAFEALCDGTAPADPLVNTESAGGTLDAGSQFTYGLTVTEAGLWYLDRNAIPDYYAYYYSGARVLDAHGAVVATGWDTAIWLKPGQYSVEVSATYNAASYDFTWRRLDTLTPLPYGQSVSMASASVYQMRAYRVDAQAGDQLRFNALSSSGSNLRWMAVNRNGQALTGWNWGNADASAFTVQDTGPVTFLFDWANYSYGSGINGAV